MKYVAVVVAAVILSGCSVAQTENIAMAQAKAHCESKGEKFVYNDTAQTPHGVITEVTVSGYCAP